MSSEFSLQMVKVDSEDPLGMAGAPASMMDEIDLASGKEKVITDCMTSPKMTLMMNRGS